MIVGTGTNTGNISRYTANRQPERPEYYQVLQPGTRGAGFMALQKEASAAPGAVTPWMQAQQGLAAKSAQEASNQAAMQAAKAAGSSAAQMSMQGGLTGGARERLLQSKDRATAMGAGQAGAQYQKGMMDIGSTAEKNRLQTIGALSDAESAGYSRDLQQEQMRNAALQNAYGQEMSAWAANKTAQAQKNIAENTGGLFGHGGFLGLGL